jgi:hypothetical protein
MEVVFALSPVLPAEIAWFKYGDLGSALYGTVG